MSKQGDDNNDGSEENPWLTIQRAARSLNPGDTVMVTRTAEFPSMAPNPDKTKCTLYMDNIAIKDKDYCVQNRKPRIEWGYNFWHDNNNDDGIKPRVWSLSEF